MTHLTTAATLFFKSSARLRRTVEAALDGRTAVASWRGPMDAHDLGAQVRQQRAAERDGLTRPVL